MTKRIAVRLPDGLVERLDARVPGTHGSRSEAIRRAIELYLHRLACEADAEHYAAVPLADADIALADDPSGWSGTPAW